MKATGNILIVEDSYSSLAYIASLIEEEGYTTKPVNSGEAALKLLNEFTPDLILLDVGLEKVSGFDICKIIKLNERFKEVPVIFLTGRNSKEDVIKGFEVGAADYITKPFSKEELILRIRTHLQLYNYTKLFKKKTAEKLIESEVQLKKKNRELQKLNEVAEENEKKFRALFENSPDIVALVNSQGEFVDINKTFDNKCKSDIIGERVDASLTASQAKEFWCALENAKLYGIPQSYFPTVKNAKGRVRYWHNRVSAITDEQGEAFFIISFTEITEQKLIEKELIEAKRSAEESEERLELVIKGSNDAPWDWNLEKNEIFYSTQWWEQVGYVPSSIPNDPMFLEKLLHPEDKNKLEEAMAGAIAKNEESFAVEYRLKSKTGDYIPILSRGFISYNVEGKAIRVSGLNMDLTERKAFEQELIEAKEQAQESDRLKTEFIRNLSHEVRTPLNGILGFANLLENQSDESESCKQYVNIIKASGEQLLHIINEILEISRLETKTEEVKCAEVNAVEMMDELYLLFKLKQTKSTIDFVLEHPEKRIDKNILLDRVRTTTIINNLIENAFKFTLEGKIEVKYYYVVHEDRDWLNVSIKDTGIGIDPQNHKSIFKRFSQEDKELSRSVGGLGLGLSIAEENAKLMGGSITLISQKGEGAEFIVNIPIEYVNRSGGLQAQIPRKRIKAANKTILVVEDENTNYYLLKSYLEEGMGFEGTIVHALNGQEAIDYCSKGDEFCMILLDMKMPVMDGYEAAGKLKKLCPEVPIIAQSAYSVQEDIDKALDAGCDHFISKPIDPEKFFSLAEQYLKEEVV